MSTPTTNLSTKSTTTSGETHHHPIPSSSNKPQRLLFTQEDEANLLKSFFKISKSTHPSSPPTINTPILEHLETTLSSDSKFSHTQIIDKLRRLRLKYHKHARTKSLMKTPHDRRIYKIARKIWGKTPLQNKKHSKETVARREEADLEKFPVLVKEVSRFLPGNVAWKEGFSCLEEEKLRSLNEKWMLLRIEEAGLMAKRAQLVQEQMKVILEAVMANDQAHKLGSN